MDEWYHLFWLNIPLELMDSDTLQNYFSIEMAS